VPEVVRPPGQANYYRIGASKKAYQALDSYLWQRLYKWASAGTSRRARNRRLVRTVRRAEPDSPGAEVVNRSITDGRSSTSGTGSSPSGTA
jgi:Group II intron, maturase-specific domain